MGSWKEEVTMVQISQEQVEADLQCYICLDDLVAGEEVMRLSCSHHYHESCISPWLDKNNICPTCRQKILCREDPDPEEYDFEFDSGFLTDIIREINNIVYGVDSDEEFLYSDSPGIIDLSSSDSETILFDSARNERNSNTSQDTRANESENNSDHEVILTYSPEPERNVSTQNEQQTPLTEASSREEPNVTRSVKRGCSIDEVEDSSDDEGGCVGDNECLTQGQNKNRWSPLSSQNAQPMKESIPYGMNINHPVGNRKKRRKRQKRSPEPDENEYNQDSSDDDLEFHSNYTTEVNSRKHEEKKQILKGGENSEELRKSSNNKSTDESHDNESDDGIFVFDMNEVESLVSKLLEIMNQGEDESNSNEDEEAVQSFPEEYSKRCVRGHENNGNAKNNESSDVECDEIYSDEDSKFHFSNKDKKLPKTADLVFKDGLNNNVRSDRLDRNSSPCQRRGSKEKSVKRKIISTRGSDSERYEDNNEPPVKRKASRSDSESSNDDDSDGFENIEQIISELWSIVSQDGDESEADQIALSSEKTCNLKTAQTCLQDKESSIRYKRNHKPIFQGKNN